MSLRIHLSAASDIELNVVKARLAQTHTHHLSFSQTGIGGMHTLFQLLTLDKSSMDYAIQVGIAGTFTPKFPLGQTVIVQKEAWGDLGVWENNNFKSIFEMGLQDKNAFPYVEGELLNPSAERWSKLTSLPLAKSASVNQITTHPLHIKDLETKGFDIESMEGAAFHYFCLQKQIPFIQLRSISNPVGVRDKSKWNIPLALDRLVESLNVVLKKIR